MLIAPHGLCQGSVSCRQARLNAGARSGGLARPLTRTAGQRATCRKLFGASGFRHVGSSTANRRPPAHCSEIFRLTPSRGLGNVVQAQSALFAEHERWSPSAAATEICVEQGVYETSPRPFENLDNDGARCYSERVR